MARTYSPFGLVTLPRVDAHAAIALAKSIESAAAEQGALPVPVPAALESIAAGREILQAAKGMSESTTTVRDADRAVDEVACALHALLSAWARLGGDVPLGKKAQALLDRLFGNGLAFINYKVEKEWAVVDGMLKAIDADNLEPVFAELGATPMLASLKAAHATYGAVIGTTKAEPEPLEIGEKREALLDAIRLYVVRVAGTVEPGDKSTETRANALLRPITEWRVDKPKDKDKEKDKPKDKDKPKGGAAAPKEAGSGASPEGGAAPPKEAGSGASPEGGAAPPKEGQSAATSEGGAAPPKEEGSCAPSAGGAAPPKETSSAAPAGAGDDGTS